MAGILNPPGRGRADALGTAMILGQGNVRWAEIVAKVRHGGRDSTQKREATASCRGLNGGRFASHGPGLAARLAGWSCSRHLELGGSGPLATQHCYFRREGDVKHFVSGAGSCLVGDADPLTFVPPRRLALEPALEREFEHLVHVLDERELETRAHVVGQLGEVLL